MEQSFSITLLNLHAWDPVVTLATSGEGGLQLQHLSLSKVRTCLSLQPLAEELGGITAAEVSPGHVARQDHSVPSESTPTWSP